MATQIKTITANQRKQITDQVSRRIAGHPLRIDRWELDPSGKESDILVIRWTGPLAGFDGLRLLAEKIMADLEILIALVR